MYITAESSCIANTVLLDKDNMLITCQRFLPWEVSIFLSQQAVQFCMNERLQTTSVTAISINPRVQLPSFKAPHLRFLLVC